MSLNTLGVVATMNISSYANAASGRLILVDLRSGHGVVEQSRWLGIEGSSSRKARLP